jgi:AraC family transcriptional regulator
MYHLITKANAELNDLPQDSNLINFSLLRKINTDLVFRSFSIKYVVEGCESYEVNGQQYEVKAGEYLLANKSCEGRVAFEANSLVKGICIDLSPELMAEVIAHHLTDSNSADLELSHYFNGEKFLENTYHGMSTQLGQVLGHLGQELLQNVTQDHQFNKEFYYHLAENLLKDQLPLHQDSQKFSSKKWASRKDNYRKLMQAKAFIENHCCQNISIAEIANQAMMSEYHFLRLFKQVYQQSPHQFLTTQRLLKAIDLLSFDQKAVGEVALYTGFSSIHSFSKAFKKYFGQSPRAYLKSA